MDENINREKLLSNKEKNFVEYKSAYSGNITWDRQLFNVAFRHYFLFEMTEMKVMF